MYWSSSGFICNPFLAQKSLSRNRIRIVFSWAPVSKLEQLINSTLLCNGTFQSHRPICATTLQIIMFSLLSPMRKRSSIYDFHTEGIGDQAQVDACGRMERDQLHVDVHTEN